MMLLKMHLLVACSLATVAGDISAYQHYIDLIYKKADTNGDKALQCSEFEGLVTKLGMWCTTSLHPPNCVDHVTERCANADANGDGGITESELIDYTNAMIASGASASDKALGQAFLEKLTNV